MRKALVMGSVVWLAWTTPTSAQTADDSWKWSVHLSAAAVTRTTEWSISHPTHYGPATVWETFTGTFTQSLEVQAGVELRRRHVGLRGTFGVLPQRFKQDAPARESRLTLLLGGLAAVLYPTAGTGRSWEPYLALGVGGQKATGDMDNWGYYLSGAVGVEKALTSRVALDAGAQVQRLNYTQVEVGSQIARDARTHPFSLYLGARIGG